MGGGGLTPVGVAYAAAGGALGALITGGDPGMAAATSAITMTTSMTLFGDNGIDLSGGSLTDQFLKELAASSGVGALAGGVTAEIFGGDFWEGAMWGAAGAASGYIIDVVLVEFFTPEMKAAEFADPKDVDLDIVEREAQGRYDSATLEASEKIWQRSIKENNERAGLIYLDDNSNYEIMPSLKGKMKSFDPEKLFRTATQMGIPRENIIEIYHSHGRWHPRYLNEHLSGMSGDKGVAKWYKVNISVVTPRGKVLRYDYITNKTTKLGKLRK